MSAEQMNTKTRVLIADDHSMVLEVLSLFLSSQPDLEVLSAGDLDGALKLIADVGPVDVTLLDLNMPGMNGLEGLRRALDASEGKPVAIITGTPTRRVLDETLEMGGAGLIPKTMQARSLANAIRFIASGEVYTPLSLMHEETNTNNNANSPLSEREMTVLNYLGEGKQNKEIAFELDLSEATIKMHVRSICTKLSANNRTHAVFIARNTGLL